jgi:Uma2 family endonuclease
MIMGAPLTIPRRMLTVDEYHKIGDAGVLSPEDRIELIEGEMIKMAPIGARHFAMVNKLCALLVAAVGSEGIVSVKIRLSYHHAMNHSPTLRY